MKTARIILAALFIFTVASVTPAQRRSVQTRFGMETPVRRPVRLPADVLRQLVSIEGDRLSRCAELSGAASLRAYFTASAVDINGDGQSDIVVQAGENGCLNGANIAPFWVFAKVGLRTEPGHELLFTTRALHIGILKTSSNGYRDIVAGGATAAEYYETVYKFDGQKYQPRSCTVQEFKTRRTVRVRCPSE